MFTESLTIRILGDSSQLQRELEGGAQRIGDLERRLSKLGGLDRELGRAFGGFRTLVQPLEIVSRWLERITGQIQTLNNTPVTLNVAPALAALAALSQMIDLIIAKLRMLSLGGFGGGVPVPMPAPLPIRQFASGGLVEGPAGLDQVPALLTAGEFVLRRPVVQEIGAAFLEALNGGGGARRSRADAKPQAAGSAVEVSRVTNFGGVTIQVGQAADVNAVVRDLRLQGARLRNRRG